MVQNMTPSAISNEDGGVAVVAEACVRESAIRGFAGYSKVATKSASALKVTIVAMYALRARGI
jgi:hypothetical protein